MEHKLDQLLNHYAQSGASNFNPILPDQIYDRSLVTPQDALNFPVIALAVIENKEKKVIVSTKGVMVIQGPPKGGKGKTYTTFLIACLTGAFGPFVSDLVGRKVVILHSDDNRHNLALMAFEISRLCGVENGFHENLIILDIGQLNIEEKYAALDAVLSKHPKIGVCVLDLAWDWIHSVNNEEESKQMLDSFLNLAIKYDFLLIIVTHEARMSHSAKGHQGAHWVAKAQSVLRVRKKQHGFIISPLFLRGRDFNEIRFTYDGTKFSFINELIGSDSITKMSKGDFSSLPDETHLQILSTLEQRDYTATELREKIRAAYSKSIRRIGINLGKDLMTFYRNRGWVVTKERKSSYHHGLVVVLKTPPYRTTVQPIRPKENTLDQPSTDQFISILKQPTQIN